MNKHPESLKDVAALLEVGTGKRLIDEIRSEFDAFIEIETRLASESYGTAIETKNWTRNVTLGILVFAICASGFVVKILGQAIARPLRELSSGAEAIGGGDLGVQVRVSSSDELGVLAVAFNSMSLNLKRIDSMRQLAETSLEQTNQELEERIKERTIKLQEANDRLLLEVESRQESEERVRLLLDSTGEGIFGLDLEGNCTFCNRACIDTLGYHHADELLGQNMHDLIHHTRSDGSVQLLQEPRNDGYFSSSEGVHVDDEVLWKANRSSFPVTFRSFPVRHEAEIVGFVVTFLDITERKQVAEQLRLQRTELAHAGRLSTLGEMAAGLAHELNQPLTAISAFAEGSLLRLDRGRLSEPEIVSTFGRIAEAAQLAGGIIRRLRSFVQKREAQYLSVDINHLVDDVHKFVEAELKQQKISIEFNLAATLPTVEADFIELQQVLLNLIRNASDAIVEDDDDEQFIAISTSENNAGFVEITVEDSGPGISQNMSEQAFEPFYTSKANGLGIGLGICQRIVEAHRGRIWIGDSPLGGASVHVELPTTPLERKPNES